MKASLVFLAAGFGSRFGGVKQLEPVGPNGEVLMDYSAYDALRAGFDRVVFIIRRDLEKEFRAGIGGRIEKKCDVEYVFQELDDLPPGFSVPDGRVKPWGTGQALLACRKVIREPFCVLNADDFYGADAFVKMRASLENMGKDAMMRCSLVGYVLGNTLSDCGAVTRGLCRVDERDGLQAIHEVRGIYRHEGHPCVEVDGAPQRLEDGMTVSMNMWGMPAEFIAYLEEKFPRFLRNLPEGDTTREFLLPSIVEKMLEEERGCVDVIRTHEKWFGMTYAQDREDARRRVKELVAGGFYPEKL